MLGAAISNVEVTNVTRQGVWLCVNDHEYFLSFVNHPWFLDVAIGQLSNVEIIHGFHLRWPDLDVDLELDSLRKPEDYPLLNHQWNNSTHCGMAALTRQPL